MTPDQANRIYQWLDAPDSSGNWFIEGADYIRWKETPDSALWVYGTPGCGKTVICSTIIEKIREECAAEPTFACAYFFFDNRNEQTELSLHEKFIRSIVRQLSHQSTGFPTPLVELYDGGQQQASLASLQLILQTIASGFERTYIIVDALDECIDRERVMAWIAQLMQCKAGNMHVLVSSRREMDIEDQFDAIPGLARTPLTGARANADIKVFLDAMLSKMTKWDTQTIARVKEALIAGADGMCVSIPPRCHFQLTEYSPGFDG
ncbi:hypothetical protein FIBSPDRAFT_583534 [Athelia psychrophila]|uniref:Nephrocystin 3-like N-terminal domain-containing protein n=1 Tax=Athelia psychrophila TaxID=1759441 RepID=A0A166HEI0_9AGAM|nr:hypothetical protein FIBSPDRAFT_583534 [Fibularhizoctonia sp. CBS 109695]